jgi:hypothetical protein
MINSTEANTIIRLVFKMNEHQLHTTLRALQQEIDYRGVEQ